MDESAASFFLGLTVILGTFVCFIMLSILFVVEAMKRKDTIVFTEEIEAGAKLLDEKIPDWLEKQNLEKLDLCDTCDCVVGQANPEVDYVDTLMELFDENDDQVALNHSHLYGFAIHPDGKYADYEDLTTEWKSYIQERRTKQKSTIEQVP